jgi:hypothetical protein
VTTLPMDDDELLERLRVAASVHDAVPLDVLAAARGAFALRTLDDELADLLFDSLLDEDLVGVRGGGPRQLSFGADEVTIDVDVDDHGIVGQLAGPEATGVELQTPDVRLAADVDDLGRFFLDHLPAGPFRLRIDLGGRRVTTEWVNL